MPPITQPTRIEPIHLERLARWGVLVAGLPQEVSGAPTRRQTLDDLVVETCWAQARPLHDG